VGAATSGDAALHKPRCHCRRRCRRHRHRPCSSRRPSLRVARSATAARSARAASRAAAPTATRAAAARAAAAAPPRWAAAARAARAVAAVAITPTAAEAAAPAAAPAGAAAATATATAWPPPCRAAAAAALPPPCRAAAPRFPWSGAAATLLELGHWRVGLCALRSPPPRLSTCGRGRLPVERWGCRAARAGCSVGSSDRASARGRLVVRSRTSPRCNLLFSFLVAIAHCCSLVTTMTRVNPFFSNEKQSAAHSHWRTHVSADLLKAFDNTCPERHRLIRWWCISKSARAGLIRTIVTAHQPVARWRVPTEVFTLLCWSRSTSGDFGNFISKSLARAK
jgi:hypothetical protein